MTAQQRFRLSVILFLLTGCLVSAPQSCHLGFGLSRGGLQPNLYGPWGKPGLECGGDPAVTGQGTFQLKGVTFEEALSGCCSGERLHLPHQREHPSRFFRPIHCRAE